jgi:hypothetical protein
MAMSSTSCNICRGTAAPFARATILGRHDVQYFRCANCGFVQTEPPYWLDEAYRSAITATDLGVISRATTFSRFTRNLILACFDSNAQFVDYGGGPGVFVRMMRDLGFDFYLHDKYAENLYARGFTTELAGGERYELATAFEVFEHLVDPLAEIERLLRASRSILFSTLLLPAYSPLPGQWWYYGVEHGQHVSIYSYGALATIASQFGLHLHTNGSGLHLLTDKKIPPLLFRTMFRRKVTALMNVFLERRHRKKSLLEEDFYRNSGLRMH